MLGDHMNDTNLVIADADILISLYSADDVNHQIVDDQTQKLVNLAYKIKFPITAIMEAITSLKRMSNKPEIAYLINQKYLNEEFNVVYVDEEIGKLASEIFGKANSKKNTVFDAVVLAAAKTWKAAAVFSFDSWYAKQGIKTVTDLIGSRARGWI